MKRRRAVWRGRLTSHPFLLHHPRIIADVITTRWYRSDDLEPPHYDDDGDKTIVQSLVQTIGKAAFFLQPLPLPPAT